jgi:hypothetical protein
MNFDLLLWQVQSSVSFLHNISSYEASQFSGIYNHHIKKFLDMNYSVVVRML